MEKISPMIIPMQQGKGKSQMSGFMMVELMIAIFLLLIGVLGATQMQASSTRFNAMSKNLTSAIVCAQSVMEEILTTPYDQVTQAKFSQVTSADYPNYTIRVTIADQPVGTVPPLWKNISVQVSWRDIPLHTYTLNSTLAYPSSVLP
jgi:Tfp pilus assembly protein PilV